MKHHNARGVTRSFENIITKLSRFIDNVVKLKIEMILTVRILCGFFNLTSKELSMMGVVLMCTKTYNVNCRGVTQGKGVVWERRLLNGLHSDRFF